MNNTVVSPKSSRVYRHRQDSPYYFEEKSNSTSSKYSNNSNSSIINQINIEELSFDAKIKLLQKLVEAYRPELTDMNNRLEHQFYILFNSRNAEEVNEIKQTNYGGDNVTNFFWSEDQYIWHNEDTNTLYIM